MRLCECAHACANGTLTEHERTRMPYRFASNIAPRSKGTPLGTSRVVVRLELAFLVGGARLVGRLQVGPFEADMVPPGKRGHPANQVMTTRLVRPSWRS